MFSQEVTKLCSLLYLFLTIGIAKTTVIAILSKKQLKRGNCEHLILIKINLPFLYFSCLLFLFIYLLFFYFYYFLYFVLLFFYFHFKIGLQMGAQILSSVFHMGSSQHPSWNPGQTLSSGPIGDLWPINRSGSQSGSGADPDPRPNPVLSPTCSEP